MKITSSFICFLISISLYAQDHELKKIRDLNVVQSLRDYFNDISDTLSVLELKTRIDSLVLDEYGRITDRDIGFDHRHHIWRVNLLETEREEYFSLISFNGNVVGLDFQSERFDSSYISWMNYERLQKMILFKEDSLNENINLDYELLFPFRVRMFGYWCGSGGSPPEFRIKMLDLVNDRNKEVLRNWLLSFNPEIQAYGAEGLFFLDREGIPITDQELEIIENLRLINNTLIACHGCSFYERHSFNQHLNRRSIRRNFKGFNSSGWLYDKSKFSSN